MDDGKFQWDDAKAASNLARHGVRFGTARGVFDDAFAVEWIDERQNYGEDRYVVLGTVGGRLLCVVYTMRDDAIRIISARGAEPHEQRRYHQDDA